MLNCIFCFCCVKLHLITNYTYTNSDNNYNFTETKLLEDKFNMEYGSTDEGSELAIVGEHPVLTSNSNQSYEN